MSFRLDRDLILFDLETSGDTPADSSVIQIGAYRVLRNGEIDNDSFNVYIKHYNRRWSKEAEQVHHLTKKFLDNNGIRIKEALKKFEDWACKSTEDNFNKVYLAQWSCGFDTNMLQSAYSFCKMNYPFSYRAYDIASFCRLVLACGNESVKTKTRGIGLASVAEKFNIDLTEFKAHNALEDARMTALVFKKAIERVEEKSNNSK